MLLSFIISTDGSTRAIRQKKKNRKKKKKKRKSKKKKVWKEEKNSTLIQNFKCKNHHL